MSWKNQQELIAEYSDPEFTERFASAFTISHFLGRCIVGPNYTPPTGLEKLIVLSESGKEYYLRLKKELPSTPESELHLTFFIKLFHQELLIDLTRTNIDGLTEILTNEMLSKRIRFPWLYGRTLYDRFFELFPNKTRKLSPDETLQLIEGSPQGVYQLRKHLLGPFGVLESVGSRAIPALRSAPLWHCSDPSCDALHVVTLSSFPSTVSGALTVLNKLCEKEEGGASEWGGYFSEFDGSSDHYDDLRLDDLHWLLGNSLSEREIRSLTEYVIDNHSKVIRPRFPNGAQYAKLFSASGEAISSRLGKAECLQLLLLLSDETIATALESLIDNRVIHIPATEKRTVKLSTRIRGWFRVTTELSRYGVRSIALRESLSLAKLKRLIRCIYEEGDDLSQLEWQLRRYSGDSIYERLDNYLHIENPEDILEKLLFARPEYLNKTMSVLRYGSFALPNSAEEETHFKKKLLWKLGFDIGIYPENQSRFWVRQEALLDIANSSRGGSEHEKEAIRGVAVNFFVSLEELLADSLYFITWVLLSDHYGVTEYRYNPDNARAFASQVLSEHAKDENLQFDEAGKTTLYPLIRGFRLLATICTELIKFNGLVCRRLDEFLPGYYRRTEIDLFPFVHRALVMDLRPQDRERIFSLLCDVTSQLDKFNVCDVRNRIEHRRELFPKNEEIVNACDAIARIATQLETSGVSPLVYLYAGTETDEFGRKQIHLRDYKSRAITLRLPSQYRLCTLASHRYPQVIVPWINVGDSSDKIRFAIEESSEYVQLWKGYPKRRERRAPASKDAEDRS